MATIILNPAFILNFLVGVEYLDNFDDFFVYFVDLKSLNSFFAIKCLAIHN